MMTCRRLTRSTNFRLLSDKLYSQNAPTLTPLHKIVSRTDPFKFHLFTTSATASGPRSTYSGSNPPVEVERRTVLSDELSRSKNVVRLSCDSTDEEGRSGSCDVYVIGTRHGSEVVFLEVCESRGNTLTNQGDELGVVPISEFRVAYEEAKKYGGKVRLGDRPIHITHSRILDKLSGWDIMKNFLMEAFYLKDHKDLKTWVNDKNNIDKVAPIIESVSKILPTYVEAVVNERDRYMAYQLLRVASTHRSVVAVVGMAHLQGMKKHWQQPVNIEELMQQMPQEKVFISWVPIIAFFGAICAGVIMF